MDKISKLTAALRHVTQDNEVVSQFNKRKKKYPSLQLANIVFETNQKPNHHAAQHHH